MKIGILFKHETANYAAEELKKYIKLMGYFTEIYISADADADIQLRLLENPDVEDAFFDDLFEIDIKNGKGYIAGSNPRSVLFGVYDYLKSCGCRWIRPGKNGDFVPEFDILNHAFKCTRKANLKIRCEMIEGAISVEHVVDSIDFMAKNYYNSFYDQFVYPYTFFRRWYEHQYSKTKQPETVSFEEMERFTDQIEQEVKKRGLLLHNLGHGYLFEPFGIRYYGNQPDLVLPENIKQYVAMVDGKRDIHGGSINYTQLCYSNPKVRRMLVEYMLKFLKERPRTDVLRVLIADGADNQCECDECRKLTPSDYFVMFMNELDEAFTREGIQTKIFFSLYVDLLWPPVKEYIKNSSRFFANVAFVKGKDKPSAEKIPAFVLNKYNPFCGGTVTALDYMEAWKSYYKGLFSTTSYCMYVSHFYDPGHFELSENIVKDIQEFLKFNLVGFTSCQTMRYGFPTALPNAVIGAASFDTSFDFDIFTDEYFKGAYGNDWEKVKAYLKEITERFSPSSLMITEDVVLQDTDPERDEPIVQKTYVGNPEIQKNLKSIASFVDSFMPSIESRLNEADPCRRTSWEYLKYHGEYCKRYAEIFYCLSRQDVENAYEKIEDMMEWLSETEDIFGRHFDMFLLNYRILRLTIIRMRRKLGLPDTIKLI